MIRTDDSQIHHCHIYLQNASGYNKIGETSHVGFKQDNWFYMPKACPYLLEHTVSE